ncbi:hypothetical protein MMAD_30610 [Mycolicibacterium madagascariense]|uniref:Uncharacterized protein n=1 Tax=Mycolicibacterium madagascariense TaxID=212765 RepID=A0A7I7XHT2_9MYCO|nr:DUF881 domain-containing protein [Mycolicibacterium madagascariense]MCV7014584.1 DUF881 domain-containing protein [Mycolicibacterium madagascariense]BBZ28766.1 hypothetical protein MMAD_30610 [Mycolicibacterium madagascariense]
MAEDERALGGYSPEAGRNAHEAGAPTLIPVPSLLRSLLSEHLDPGYAAAARRREGSGPRRRSSALAWQIVAGLLVATVFAAAAAQAQSVAPAAQDGRHVLADGVRAAQRATNDAIARRRDLTGQVEAERRHRLAGDEQGRRLLSGLDAAEFTAAETAVRGPGLSVTVTEPSGARDLSDVSKQRVQGSPQVILDRDLQLVVNSLWASGAEAIAVGGVRIGPGVTVRQAGGRLLVDNQPIANPYVVLAVGPPHAMSDAFGESPAAQRLQILESAYGVTVAVGQADALTLPAGSVRDVHFATVMGPR